MDGLLDLCVLAVIGVSVYMSSRRGFMRTLIEAVGFVLAAVIAFSASKPIAEFVYDKTIEPAIVASVEEAATNATEETVLKIWDGIPKFITESKLFSSVSKDRLTQSVSDNVGDAANNAAEKASKDVIRPTAVKTLTAIIATLLFILFLAVVKLLARVINKLFSFSVVGKINRILGGIVGIPKALVVAIAFCMAVTFIVSVFGTNFKFLTRNVLDGAKVFSFFVSLTPYK